jgi:hypothetical protein
MKVLDFNSGINYLHKNYPMLLSKENKYHIKLAIPETAQKHIALSQFITNNIGNLQESIIQITEWDIGEEILDLFYLLRKQINENRTIHDAPFHLFSISDHIIFQEIIALSFFFQWSILVVAKDVYIEISHDGYMEVSTDTKEKNDLFDEIFAFLEIRKIANS